MIPVQLSRNMKSQRKPAHPTAAQAPLKPQQLTSQLQALHVMSAATAQPRDCHTDPVTHDPADVVTYAHYACVADCADGLAHCKLDLTHSLA